MTSHLKKDETTSTLYYSESNWDDLRFPATAINPPGIESDPDRDALDGCFLFGFISTELIMIIAQLPHNFRLGSMLYPHIHWQPEDNNAGNVLWRLEWQAASVDGGFGGASWHEQELTTAASGDADKHSYSTFEPIDMSGYGLTTVLKMRLKRLGGNIEDTYGNDAKLVEFDIHYQKDSIGSGQQLDK